MHRGTSLCCLCGNRGPEPGCLLASPDDHKDCAFLFLSCNEKHKASSPPGLQGATVLLPNLSPAELWTGSCYNHPDVDRAGANSYCKRETRSAPGAALPHPIMSVMGQKNPALMRTNSQVSSSPPLLTNTTTLAKPQGSPWSHTSSSLGGGEMASLPSCRLQASLPPGLPRLELFQATSKAFWRLGAVNWARRKNKVLNCQVCLRRQRWETQLAFKYPFGCIFSLHKERCLISPLFFQHIFQTHNTK